jgi:hypothetical protein
MLTPPGDNVRPRNLIFVKSSLITKIKSTLTDALRVSIVPINEISEELSITFGIESLSMLKSGLVESNSPDRSIRPTVTISPGSITEPCHDHAHAASVPDSDAVDVLDQ